MSHQPNKLSWLLAILLVALQGAAHAEKADRDKPLNIESDQMSLDNINHVSIFDGKVELTQGTLRVLAEKIVVTEDATGHKFCVATGHLASFRQKRDEANEYVEGYGERIEYDTLHEQVDFYVHARVKREQDDVRGDHIIYSTQTEVFRVNSPVKSGRVRATLQPQNKENKNAAPKAGETKKAAPVAAPTNAVVEPKASEPTPAGAKVITQITAESKASEPVPTDSNPAPKQPGN